MVQVIREQYGEVSDFDLKLHAATYGYPFSETAEYLKKERNEEKTSEVDRSTGS